MFSKKPAQGSHQQNRPEGSIMNGNNSTFSVIGADVTIKGDISASADLHVDGRVEGDIACASLVQGETSEVHGQIEAATARLAGKVVGSIHARELVILKSARVEGDVHYDALTIEQGAEVEGRLSHSTPNRPAAAARPAASGDEGETDDGEPRLTLAG
jgi:cytoskeletal protein CcmA (bactofilin family)